MREKMALRSKPLVSPKLAMRDGKAVKTRRLLPVSAVNNVNELARR